jgi:hypothetical protein
MRCYLKQRRNLQSTIDTGSMGKEVNNTVGVTEFVIVPRNELDELIVKSDTSSSIEDRRL